MMKYLTSRLLLVFLCKFFLSWALNTKTQLSQFFNIDDTSIPSYIGTILILLLGIFIINALFTLVNLKDIFSHNDHIIKSIRKKGVINCFNFYIKHFWAIAKNNFEIEWESEKYPNLFMVFILFFLPFSKGNPIINNYYGIYKQYEIIDEDLNGYIENKNYIIHKSNKNEIKGRISSLEENRDEYEPDFDIKKRGYLFVQAGIIDGYKTYYKEYDGFLAYFECLCFSALEKFINSIMYFFIPFVILILIYHFRYEKE